MNVYYSKEAQKQYGVLGIGIEVNRSYLTRVIDTLER